MDVTVFDRSYIVFALARVSSFQIGCTSVPRERVSSQSVEEDEESFATKTIKVLLNQTRKSPGNRSLPVPEQLARSLDGNWLLTESLAIS